MNNLKHIARKIQKAGGKSYYVGGYVRDRLLGIKNKDIDVEVHGIKENILLGILSEFGKVEKVGKSFGVYKLNGIDFSLPRTEIKTGEKHTNFKVKINPFMGCKIACQRRDFTMNAIMEDVLTGEIIDPMDGVDDLNFKILKTCSDNSFTEDPLRALRAIQFIARFNLKVDEETLDQLKSVNLKNISKERIYEEFKKLLVKGKNIAGALYIAEHTGLFNQFLKPEELIYLSEIIDAFIILDNENETISYKFTENELETLKFSLLFYKFSRETLDSFGINQPYLINQMNMLKNLYQNKDFDLLNKEHLLLISTQTTVKMFLYFYGSLNGWINKEVEKKAIELKIFNNKIQNLISGKDLLDLGFKPGKEFGEILKDVLVMKIKDILKTKEEAIEYVKSRYIEE